MLDADAKKFPLHFLYIFVKFLGVCGERNNTGITSFCLLAELHCFNSGSNRSDSFFTVYLLPILLISALFVDLVKSSLILIYLLPSCLLLLFFHCSCYLIVSILVYCHYTKKYGKFSLTMLYQVDCHCKST